MGDTMPARTDARQYRTPRSVRLDGALSRYVDVGGSTTLGGAHAKELRLKAEIRKLMACYDPARALRFLESARAFIRGVAQVVTPARKLQAHAIDQAENTAEKCYDLGPSPATKEQWIRALYAEAAADVALARDLEAQP